MSSMIDVSFLLLIFFLLTSTLDPKEADLGMVLPTENGPSESITIDDMKINVEADGSIFVEGKLLDNNIDERTLPLLDDKLKQYKDASDLMSTQPVILVIADDEAPGQRFIDVLNALAKVDIHDVTIAGMSNK